MTEASVADNVGYYSIYQLCSVRETERKKGHAGVFHWGKTKILALVKRGEFPRPITNLGKANVWRKEAIHNYARFIEQGMSLAEAAAAAEGV